MERLTTAYIQDRQLGTRAPRWSVRFLELCHTRGRTNTERERERERKEDRRHFEGRRWRPPLSTRGKRKLDEVVIVIRKVTACVESKWGVGLVLPGNNYPMAQFPPSSLRSLVLETIIMECVVVVWKIMIGGRNEFLKSMLENFRTFQVEYLKKRKRCAENLKIFKTVYNEGWIFKISGKMTELKVVNVDVKILEAAFFLDIWHLER